MKACCDGCGGNPEGLDELLTREACGRDLCEACYGDGSMEWCHDCLARERRSRRRKGALTMATIDEVLRGSFPPMARLSGRGEVIVMDSRTHVTVLQAVAPECCETDLGGVVRAPTWLRGIAIEVEDDPWRAADLALALARSGRRVVVCHKSRALMRLVEDLRACRGPWLRRSLVDLGSPA